MLKLQLIRYELVLQLNDTILNIYQSFTADPVQPTGYSLLPGSIVPAKFAMSSSGDTGSRPSGGGGNESKHLSSCSSPLSHFSLDIPSGILPTHLTTLPHQSYSVPFVPHLMRAHSTHEKPVSTKVRIPEESLINPVNLCMKSMDLRENPSQRLITMQQLLSENLNIV